MPVDSSGPRQPCGLAGGDDDCTARFLQDRNKREIAALFGFEGLGLHLPGVEGSAVREARAAGYLVYEVRDGPCLRESDVRRM